MLSELIVGSSLVVFGGIILLLKPRILALGSTFPLAEAWAAAILLFL
jgi:hypothetical protein